MDEVSEIARGTLYRALAKCCHPHRAGSELERQQLGGLMQRIYLSFSS